MTNAYPIAEMIESALATLAEDLPAAGELEQVEIVLEQAGDALRAGLPLPRAVAQWMKGLAGESLGGVAERWSAWLSRAPLPADDEDLESLIGAVSLRDRSESVATAIRRACVGADRAFGDVPGFGSLTRSQREMEERLAAHVSRAAVEGALGIRRGLLVSGSWTDAIGEGDGEAITGEPPSLSGAAPSNAAPSDEIVSGYVADGSWAAWVEGFAARSPEFAEGLAATIAAFLEVRQPVGLAARRWHRGPGAVRVGFEERLAAADSDGGSTRLSVQLGTLAPTDAQARLTIEHGRVTVRVMADTGTLRAVRFGTEGLENESVPGEWELSSEWTAAPLHFSVEGADGRRFEVELELHSGSDE